jgi:membrane-bound metal-dependent hydrolase YbcI (DUF457 family)
MPVPPFHFGVGFVAKGLFPRSVSVTAFIVSQFVIDCEVMYYMLIRPGWPHHRWAHTFLVGGAIGVLVGVAVHIVATRFVAACGTRWQVPNLREAALRPAVIGGALGGLTHPILDGIMHDGIAPLRPFLNANPFKGLVSIPTLHGLLIATAVLGVAVLALNWRRVLGAAPRRSVPTARRPMNQVTRAHPSAPWRMPWTGSLMCEEAVGSHGSFPLPTTMEAGLPRSWRRFELRCRLARADATSLGPVGH